MNPSRFRRWLVSKTMSRIAHEKTEKRRHMRAEILRKKKGYPHIVEYFHQVDDAYSWLAIQTIESLSARYHIEIEVHLVSGPQDKNLPEPELAKKLAAIDAKKIAPHYDLSLPDSLASIDCKSKLLLNKTLAANGNFIANGMAILEQLNSGTFAEIENDFPKASDHELKGRLSDGDARLTKLSHYSGAMFFYGDEWYWGVDRLYLLEKRLKELGLDREPERDPCFARPALEMNPGLGKGLTMEFYASLRSPYTAVIFDHVVNFAKSVDLRIDLKPVLPMVMRGVSLTREKGFYIFSDAAREARALGDWFGPWYDPIGEPVLRAYSLYPWAKSRGKHVAFFSAFLSAAFKEGVNTMTDRGLSKVVRAAGLDWTEARKLVGSSGWEDELEENRLRMYSFGSWGVPSFRILDSNGNEVTWAWGQDRLWFLEKEIVAAKNRSFQ